MTTTTTNIITEDIFTSADMYSPKYNYTKVNEESWSMNGEIEERLQQKALSDTTSEEAGNKRLNRLELITMSVLTLAFTIYTRTNI